MVIDYAATGQGAEDVGLCFMLPAVTDYTLQDAKCWQQGPRDNTPAGTKRETSRIFGTGGRWTLVIGSAYCFERFQDTDCPNRWPTQYQLIAHIRHATRMNLVTRALVVKRSSTIKLTGRVVGAQSGNVAIQTRSGLRWVNIGVAPIASTGAFRYSLRPTTAGKVSYRALYPGDSGHRPSSAAIRITVV